MLTMQRPAMLVALASGFLAGTFTSTTPAHAIDSAAVKITPIEDGTWDRVYSDPPTQQGEHSQVSYEVEYQIKYSGGSTSSWIEHPQSSWYISPKDWVGCTLDYVPRWDPGSGNQVRFSVRSVVDAEQLPIYECGDDARLDPVTASASQQYTDWLNPGEFETLYFAYTIIP